MRKEALAERISDAEPFERLPRPRDQRAPA